MLLLGRAGNSSTVGLSVAWPSSFQIVCLEFATAARRKVLELLSNEISSSGRADLTIEEGVQVRADNVDDWAESGGVLLNDIERLRGGDRTIVTSSLQDTLGFHDKVGHFGSCSETSKDCFIACDDHFDHAPVSIRTPLGQVVELIVRSSHAFAIDEDAEDHLHTNCFAGCANILRTLAVRGVNAHRREALGFDAVDVIAHFVSGLATAVGCVRGVGHGPFVSGRCTWRADRTLWGFWLRCWLGGRAWRLFRFSWRLGWSGRRRWRLDCVLWWWRLSGRCWLWRCCWSRRLGCRCCRA